MHLPSITFNRSEEACLKKINNSKPATKNNVILVCCGLESALRHAGFPKGQDEQTIVNAFKESFLKV